MTNRELVKTLAIESEVISRLIQEAEASVDEEQRLALYGMARDQCENISRSLRSYLDRELPGPHLNAA